MKVIFTSEIKYPYCNFTKEEKISINSYQILFTSKHFSKSLTVKNRNCFVSYTNEIVFFTYIKENKDYFIYE